MEHVIKVLAELSRLPAAALAFGASGVSAAIAFAASGVSAALLLLAGTACGPAAVPARCPNWGRQHFVFTL